MPEGTGKRPWSPQKMPTGHRFVEGSKEASRPTAVPVFGIGTQEASSPLKMPEGTDKRPLSPTKMPAGL